jgi:hypothetical protein
MAARGYKCVLTIGNSTMGIARRVDPKIIVGEQDITCRDSDGWEEAQPGKRRLAFRIEALWVPTDAALKAIEDSVFNQTTVSFTLTDENGYGYSGSCVVGEFAPGPQDDEHAVMCSCTCRSTGTVSRSVPVATTTAGA